LSWCLATIVLFPTPFHVCNQTWTLVYILVWITCITRSPTWTKFGFSPMMITTPKPCNRKMATMFISSMPNMGNGKLNSLTTNISSMCWAYPNQSLLLWSIVMPHAYFWFKPSTPNIIHNIHRQIWILGSNCSDTKKETIQNLAKPMQEMFMAHPKLMSKVLLLEFNQQSLFYINLYWILIPK